MTNIIKANRYYSKQAVDKHFERFVSLLNLPVDNMVLPRVILLYINRRYAVAVRNDDTGAYAMSFGNEFRTAKEIIHWFEGAIQYHYGIQYLRPELELYPEKRPSTKCYPTGH